MTESRLNASHVRPDRGVVARVEDRRWRRRRRPPPAPPCPCRCCRDGRRSAAPRSRPRRARAGRDPRPAPRRRCRTSCSGRRSRWRSRSAAASGRSSRRRAPGGRPPRRAAAPRGRGTRRAASSPGPPRRRGSSPFQGCHHRAAASASPSPTSRSRSLRACWTSSRAAPLADQPPDRERDQPDEAAAQRRRDDHVAELLAHLGRSGPRAGWRCRRSAGAARRPRSRRSCPG